MLAPDCGKGGGKLLPPLVRPWRVCSRKHGQWHSSFESESCSLPPSGNPTCYSASLIRASSTDSRKHESAEVRARAAALRPGLCVDATCFSLRDALQTSGEPFHSPSSRQQGRDTPASCSAMAEETALRRRPSRPPALAMKPSRTGSPYALLHSSLANGRRTC